MSSEDKPSARELIDRVEAYFANADRCDVAATLSDMAPDCLLEYLTEGLCYAGRDGAIKTYFEERARQVVKSWHGNFMHAADANSGRVATRFEVRRTVNERMKDEELIRIMTETAGVGGFDQLVGGTGAVGEGGGEEAFGFVARGAAVGFVVGRR